MSSLEYLAVCSFILVVVISVYSTFSKYFTHNNQRFKPCTFVGFIVWLGMVGYIYMAVTVTAITHLFK